MSVPLTWKVSIYISELSMVDVWCFKWKQVIKQNSGNKRRNIFSECWQCLSIVGPISEQSINGSLGGWKAEKNRQIKK